MYHHYFGLDEQAFSIAVNPRYLYMSAQHREALAHLLYGVSSGGFVMLTGEVGTGKTTIIRCLLEQLPEQADLAVVMNPSASARDLLCSICDEFGIAYQADEASIKILTDKLTEFLVANYHRGRQSIVLIDEAQLLRISTLEQVRLLTNLETNTEKLLQIILVGQPELNELLAKPALRQLSQRITARYHLRPLSEKETESYIKHRLSVAGMPPGRHPFPARIVRKVFQISGGIPRLINILCDRMLLGAYSREASQIDAEICRQATVEVLGETERARPRSQRQWLYGAAGVSAVAIACVLIAALLGGGEVLGPSSPSADNLQVVGEGKVERRGDEQAGGRVDQSPGATEGLGLYGNRDRALGELLAAVEIPYDGTLYPCWVASQQGYKCETQKVDTWQEFRQYNRPAVLALITESKQAAYAALVGLNDRDAWLRQNGEISKVSLQELGELWTGEFVFIWQRPEHFEEAIGRGSRGPLVSWVARQFAELDAQASPLTREFFNENLQQRVKLFQQAQQLEDDGFVGLQTLLKLNEVLGLDKSLSDLEPTLVGVGGTE